MVITQQYTGTITLGSTDVVFAGVNVPEGLNGMFLYALGCRFGSITADRYNGQGIRVAIDGRWSGNQFGGTPSLCKYPNPIPLLSTSTVNFIVTLAAAAAANSTCLLELDFYYSEISEQREFGINE